MEEQNYSNHTRMDPLYHYVTALVGFFTLIGVIIYLVRSLINGENVFAAILFVLITVTLMAMIIRLRSYPLKVQDRAIRAEEQLRHFILTGRPFDPRLTLKQIISLRFADDTEFPDLCKQAAEHNWSPNQIKKSISIWRADHNRV